MKNTERKIFRKLAKKRWHNLAKLFAIIMLKTRERVSEEQFDQYLTLLGPSILKSSLRNKSERQIRKLISFTQNEVRKPERKLNIAVVMSGQPRSLEHCTKSLKRFFYGHNITYFCHLWAGQSNPDILEPLENYFFIETDSPDFSREERLAITNYGLKSFGDGVKIPYVSPNVFPMWFGVNQAFNLIESSGHSPDQYDLICRMRYDNFWVGQFDCEDIQINDKNIIIDYNYNGYGGYGDQFAIGRPSAMKEYCNLYHWLTTEFLSEPGSERCFPEVMLKNYLQKKELRVIEENFGLRLLRPEFVGLQAHQIPLRSHKASSERNSSMSRYITEKYPEIANNE
ncbi:hypothetical protein [Thalassolituus marinus]|uniref:Uncharacterized protein n=1 Tax=Thalassolituus marinus TaxID=671053 RepID=A0ABS7ZPW8_9GAMM|nr:hypothetical protein [Thalassolituus marinus]MCA6063122.1 hypothetical protein [Thalassolituus marinus]